MEASSTLEPPIERLRSWIESQHFGHVVPAESQAHQVEEADGRTAWAFVVVLEDPPPGAETWPAKDVADLERAIRDKALDLEVPWPWMVVFQPKGIEPVEDELDDD
jgi:hypothetical protein